MCGLIRLVPGGGVFDSNKLGDVVPAVDGDVVAITFVADVAGDLETEMIFCTTIGVPVCVVPTIVACS